MTREEHVDRLTEHTYDVLVIGGGATGCGTALDAASRGLKTALVERDDFSTATSSRSTKLIHGGVRYLEQAVKKFDRSQFNLVRDALKERATLLRLAPHLAHPLAILTPIYKVWEVPYYLSGLKLYDRLAGKDNLHPSRYVGAQAAREQFPMLRNDGLKGAVIYYDGQFDDARMNLEIALTAATEGATIANYVTVTELIKRDGRLAGAVVVEGQSGKDIEVLAKVVVNATGPFADGIRHLDEEDAAPMLSASSGIHIVLDRRFSPPDTGLLIPQTEDGRVLFLLPWLGHTLIGTTDNSAPIEPHPKASREEIDYILRHVREYFDLPVTEADVLASWSGLRPLVSNPQAADTARLSRDHIVNVSASGLITIAGGKWTTYRKMALDTIDEAVRVGGLEPRSSSRTDALQLVGARGYQASLAGDLEEQYAFEPDVAHYLAQTYGVRAHDVARLANDELDVRLAEDHPYLKAEVKHAARSEFARSVIDVLARRTRLGFIDRHATLTAIPAVADLLAATLGWDDRRKHLEIRAAHDYFS